MTDTSVVAIAVAAGTALSVASSLVTWYLARRSATRALMAAPAHQKAAALIGDAARVAVESRAAAVAADKLQAREARDASLAREQAAAARALAEFEQRKALDRTMAEKTAKTTAGGPAEAVSGCQPWCGLPMGDDRVPTPDKHKLFFAAGVPSMDSPVYCCPQQASSQSAVPRDDP